MAIKVRRDQLAAKGLKSGRWLQQLKNQVLAAQWQATVQLPDGSEQTVSVLAEQLLVTAPGQKLVYATDFADTEANKNKLVALAKDAHTLFCESTFMRADQQQAERTQHLTTIACAEIANRAAVGQLVPFHFSQRYDRHPQLVYEELKAVCDVPLVRG